MSRIDDLAEDLIGRCEPGPAGTCRIHHLDRDEDGHCPEWRRAVSEIDDLLEQVRSEAGANRSVVAAHDSERQRALRERDEVRAEVERLRTGIQDDRPDGCCGKCPPIGGGGYDCTCKDNPRCTASAPYSTRPKETEMSDHLDRAAAIMGGCCAHCDDLVDELLALRDEALARVLEAADERTATWLSMAREVRKHISAEKSAPADFAEAVARVTPCSCSAQRTRAEKAEAALADERDRHDATIAERDRLRDDLADMTRQRDEWQARHEALPERDEARAEVARLRAGIGTLSDWHEAKAEKADRYPGPGRDNRVAMSKAATVHRDATRRLRALLNPTEGEDR